MPVKAYKDIFDKIESTLVMIGSRNVPIDKVVSRKWWKKESVYPTL